MGFALVGLWRGFSDSNGYFRLNLPALIREFLDLVRCLLGWNFNKKKFLSLMAVNPGETDHGGGSRVTPRYQTPFRRSGQGS